jgi:septal ring factor EnvC (AmiA/AmiB activator)
LTKVVEKIFSKDSRESLRKHIAEVEAENSRLKAAAAESSETITTLQRSLDNGVEDYNLLMAGNESLLAERNELRYCTEDLESC